jgi:transcriptional regulator
LPKSKATLLQGTLDMLILKALSLGALHGYGVGQRIAQISGDALKIEEGSLYPGLYRLEQRGWIESEWDVSENNQRAKFYKLTRDGRQQLDWELDNWKRLSSAVGLVIKRA